MAHPCDGEPQQPHPRVRWVVRRAQICQGLPQGRANLALPSLVDFGVIFVVNILQLVTKAFTRIGVRVKDIQTAFGT